MVLTFQPRLFEAVPAEATLARLPAEYNQGDTLETISGLLRKGNIPTLVVLDDDPTGTQTCHDIAVLTCWDQNTLQTEFQSDKAGFFILTNSRALPTIEAKKLIKQICTEVSHAALKCGKQFQIVLRGDSTLRGHIPAEPEAVEEALGHADAWVIAPFFFQGGRLTIDDIHYVKEGDNLEPAAHTQFAKDMTFGYASSNLRDYVREKCGSRFLDSSFTSITLEDIRIGGPETVTSKLMKTPKDSVVILNAAAESDMHICAAGLLGAESSGKRYLYRTGAAFVSSRLGIRPIPPLTLEDLGIDRSNAGGLIVAGSYVPKTTAQLKALTNRRGSKLKTIELNVEDLVQTQAKARKLVQTTSEQVNALISNGEDVLVMTSRKLIDNFSLELGDRVAQALVDLVQQIAVRPRYLIAKGGITSSDAAKKGLNIKRAIVVGQALPGVPLWRCDEETSRHKAIPFVVFPGNVGSETAMAELVTRWSPTG